MSRAAYMREYRAKRKKAPMIARLNPVNAEPSEYIADSASDMVGILSSRVMFLENEVARLKRELAQRPERNPYTEFHPVPKPGKHQ